MRVLVIGLLVSIGSLCGCSSTPPPMSCTFTGTTGSYCVDFIAGFSGPTALMSCNQLMGSFSQSTSCPSSGRVGRCTETQTTAAGNQALILASYAPTTTIAARGQCPPSMPLANTMYAFQEN